MTNRVLPKIALIAAIGQSACVPPQTGPAPQPLGPPKYDYKSAQQCEAPGSSKITVGVISPQWPSSVQASGGVAMQGRGTAGAPQILLDVAPAMRQDFLELVTCRGYLTKGPFDSFEAMVFPDREASNLLLEPELQVSVSVTDVAHDSKMLFGTPTDPTPTSRYRATGNASVGGRVTLTLKEPVTNTRMWTRSIEVPAESFAFTTEQRYLGSEPPGRLRVLVVSDLALRRQLQPRLEAMYQNVLKTTESYLNKRELETVAVQATDVRKKAAISVPR